MTAARIAYAIHTGLEKSEIRISKYETNPKFKCSNDLNNKNDFFLLQSMRTKAYRFGYLNFVIRDCFEFRASNFEFKIYGFMFPNNLWSKKSLGAFP